MIIWWTKTAPVIAYAAKYVRCRRMGREGVWCSYVLNFIWRNVNSGRSRVCIHVCMCCILRSLVYLIIYSNLTEIYVLNTNIKILNIQILKRRPWMDINIHIFLPTMHVVFKLYMQDAYVDTIEPGDTSLRSQVCWCWL